MEVNRSGTAPEQVQLLPREAHHTVWAEIVHPSGPVMTHTREFALEDTACEMIAPTHLATSQLVVPSIEAFPTRRKQERQ